MSESCPCSQQSDLESNTMNESRYFRNVARELGCPNVDELGDLAVWQYIMEHQK